MCELILLADPISGERRTYPLHEGETMAGALMRLWPRGLDGGWRMYRDTVSPETEISAVELRYAVVMKGDTYLIVRAMAGPAVGAFLLELAPALFFSLAVAALTPKPPRVRDSANDLISPNNQIAGQTNTLRPGARVPDILGRVRAFPDLLCNPVDVYNESNQTIGQMFVLGVGAYEIEDPKLGETPLASLLGSDLDIFLPGEEVPPFWVMKTSREVGDVSLLGESTDALPIAGDVDFNAAAHTMTTLEAVPIGVGRPIRITGTFFNNAVFWVNAIPPATQTVGPFVYTLDGPVVDELGAEASITQIPAAIAFSRSNVYFGNTGPFNWTTPGGDDMQVQFQYGWPGATKIPLVGDLVEWRATSGEVYRGRITLTAWPLGGRAAFWGLTMNDLNGNPLIFKTFKRGAYYTSFREVAPGGGPAPTPGELPNAPTNWYAAPMAAPQEIWVDIAFPQGLAFYDNGSRQVLSVQIRVEFRRLGATDPQASVTFNFSYATAVPLRFTKRIAVGTLGLPAGSPTIEVRLVRVTPYKPDTASKNYVQESRWARLAAVVQLVGQTYPTVTVMAFTMSNTRSAGAVSDMSLNVIATRVLPTWTGSAWSAPAATRKWADNFVARCKSPDGANRTDAQLDIPGIYALQAQLDASDAGAQGVISLTLDQMQDIDSELAQIADVARAVVYRVGRKLFVQRDQANATAIALFNARAKSPDGETVSVRMTGDADNDAVIVQWMDEVLGWKRRDFQFPEDVIAVNPLRVGTSLANWTQAYRRAVFEWNRLKYRREDIACRVTEDGRICRPGDVINVTDDVANLALQAGEVIAQQAPMLTLDRDMTFDVGASYSIMLRDSAGILIDRIPVAAVLAGPIPNDIYAVTNVVYLTRAPAVRIKGRDASLGTLYAFYRDDVAAVRPWLVVGVSKSGPYVQLSGVNYTEKVYTGDSAPLPPRPPSLIPDL